jgi:hypothetical protein
MHLVADVATRQLFTGAVERPLFFLCLLGFLVVLGFSAVLGFLIVLGFVIVLVCYPYHAIPQ